MTSRITRIAAAVLFSTPWMVGLAPLGFAGDSQGPRALGLGDPGQLVEVQIDSGRTAEGGFTLDGQDARQQLIVTGKYATGQQRDLTGTASYLSTGGSSRRQSSSCSPWALCGFPPIYCKLPWAEPFCKFAWCPLSKRTLMP